MSGNTRHILVLALSVWILAACDTQGDNEVTEKRALTSWNKLTFSNGTLTLRTDSAANILNVVGLADASNRESNSALFSAAGLWLAADQNGHRSNSANILLRTNGFGLENRNAEPAGLFLINRDSLDAPISNWPVELGAPSMPDGQPILYGDVMVWAAFVPSPKYDPDRSLQGLRIGMTTYLYERKDVSSLVFVRYDITNTADETIKDLHAGFGADTDPIPLFYHDGICPGLDHWDHQTGYDVPRRLTYTYISREVGEGGLPDRCYSLTAGYSILDMTSSADMGDEILAHRIRRRDSPTIYSDFLDLDLEPGTPILNALEGLSLYGDPMIDPSDGQPTRFAFTGDPIAGSGWIDERSDTRSLLSVVPVDLAPGETRSLTVLWVFAYAVDRDASLNLLKTRFDAIVSQRDLWDF